MSSSFVQPGLVIDLVVTQTVTEGDGFVEDDLFFVAGAAGVSGDTVAAEIQGVVNLPKNDADTWAAGQKVYWHTTNDEVVNDATGSILIGYGVDVQGATTSANANVLLNPTIS